jgi:PAS domain S-box-containing protein
MKTDFKKEVINGRKSIIKYLWIIASIWSVVILTIMIIDLLHVIEDSHTIIKNEAVSYYKKDEALGFLINSQGGAYLPITEDTQPNPFLSHIPDRDLTTASNKKFTLISHSDLFNRLMERYSFLYGIKGHLVSLVDISSGKSPDSWEAEALKSFSNGEIEKNKHTQIDGEPFFRFIKPLRVKESCLTCHTSQNFKLGDSKGGISISIPISNHLKARNEIIILKLLQWLILLFIGFVPILLIGKKLEQKEEDRYQARFELENQKNKLEELVDERTEDLIKLNEQLTAVVRKKDKLQKVLIKSDKIINNSQAIAFVWKNAPNWPIEYVSQNVQEILGYSTNEFMSGKVKYADIIHKDDIKRVVAEVEQNSQIESITGFTHKNYRVWSKSGKQIWLEDRTSIIRDENGNVTFYEGIVLDVSERVKVEEENKFKTEFESKIATISTYFVNLKLKDINKALSFTAQSFGKFLQADRSYVIMANSKKELKVKSDFLMNNKTESIDTDFTFNIKSYQWLYFSLIKGKPILIENTEKLGSISKNEKELMTSFGIKSFLAVPIVINDVMYGFLGFDSKTKYGILSKKHLSLFQLLTEVITNLYSRYLNELELTQISDKNRSLIQAVEQTADSVVITDTEGKIEYVNSKFIEVTGYSFEEAIGQQPRILKSGHTSAKEYGNLWKTIKSGKPWKGQFKNINKEGNAFWEQATISPIKDKKGKITNFLAIKVDITKKLLQENQNSLSQKMESIGHMAAGIAHEINTPMQYVGDNANFLADSYSAMTSVFFDFNAYLEDGNAYSNDEIREFYQNKKEEMDLEFIFEEVPEALKQTKIGIDHITKIVRAMKDFAHPGSKEKVYFNLHSGIQNTAAISKNEWKYVAEIEFDFDDKSSEILCLQDELNQVFLNMFVNSAHSIADKNAIEKSDTLGKITIKTDKNDKTVLITISDTGNGISKENIKKIFDPFFTTKDVGKGTGQGLAIAHDIIVNKHGGTITVDSEIGVGSVFIIELPIDGV